MDYYKSEKNKEDQYEKKKVNRPFYILSVIVVLLISFAGGVVFDHFYREKINGCFFQVSKVKNIFLSTVLGDEPEFYYLDIEKNGKDYRLTKDDVFEISYRDEFVVKSISSDSLFGRGITVDVEGIGCRNDFRVLLKGIELADKLITKKKWNSNTDYKIDVRYHDKSIASIPIRVEIAPQDWLRFARRSENERSQIDYLKRAINMNKKDIGVRKMLARIYVRKGMQDSAISQYQHILKLKPDDTDTLVELSKCYIKEKKYEKTLPIYRRIIRFNPKDASAYANIAFAYGKLGRWKNAIANYNASIRYNPNNATVYYNLGKSYEKTGKIKKAIEKYKHVLKKMPRDVNVMSALADACLKAGNYDESIRLYRRIIKKQPKNASAYANIGLARGAKGQWEGEIANYKRAISLNPNDPLIHFNLAVACEKRKRYRDAAIEYEKVLKIKPDDTDAMNGLANCYLRNKKYSSAIKLYKKIVKNSPRDGSIYAGLGFAYGKTKKYKQATKNYEKAIKHGYHPTMRELNILAGYYLKIKYYNSAIKTYNKMVKLDPEKAEIYSGLAHIHGLKGNTDKEIEYYKKSLRYDKEDYMLYLNLGDAYEKKKMYGDALREYINAYQLNPDSSGAARKIPQMRIKILQQKHEKQE
ncbi:MAG: tetratricopeptide repeat protein [Thermodesulfobacteriota bacterium]|nr:tetratricopeptide repeat protein [Thermodesulfobacteriota bacterium]